MAGWERSAIGVGSSRLDALARGAGAGAIGTGLGAMPWVGVYYARHHGHVEMPWDSVVPHALTWLLFTGAMIGGLVRLSLIERRPRQPVPRLLVSATVSGSIAGLLPGIIGVAYFGGFAAPYAGTTAVLAGSFVSVGLTGLMLARWDHELGWTRAAVAAVTPLLVVAPLTFFAPLLSPSEPVLVPFELWMLLTSSTGLIALGSFVGAVSGALAGLWLVATHLLAARLSRR